MRSALPAPIDQAPVRRLNGFDVAEWASRLQATAAILLGSTWLFKLLGESVLAAMERVMGMLLIALSAQMILGGVEAYLKA